MFCVFACACVLVCVCVVVVCGGILVCEVCEVCSLRVVRPFYHLLYLPHEHGMLTIKGSPHNK